MFAGECRETFIERRIRGGANWTVGGKSAINSDEA